MAADRGEGGGLPGEFRRRLERMLPPEVFAGVWDSFHRDRPTAFRTNGLKARADQVEAELRRGGFSLERLAWKEDAFVVPPDQRRALTECAAFQEGRIYIQNPSSMVPPLVLAPRPGERILDLAAAPGSKTLQLAQMLGGEGEVAAVEAVRARFFRLRANLERHGAGHVRTFLKDGTRVWRQVPERFDRVLLDAPCSSEGLFQAADPATYAYWSRRKIAQMRRKQTRLFFAAVQCLRPGGILVYSTCTFAPEENEAVVHAALEKFAGKLEVEAVDWPCAPVQEGLTGWDGKAFAPALRRAGRILPEGAMEGFFVCRLRKLETTL